MVEIADAVLTLSTDDGPLQAGLDAAEQRIRAALDRMQRAFQQGAFSFGAETETLPQALGALAALNTAIAITAPSAFAATATLTGLRLAVDSFGDGAVTAAIRIAGALALLNAAVAGFAAFATAAASTLQAVASAATSTHAPYSGGGTGGLPILNYVPTIPTPAAQPNALIRQGPIVQTLNITVDREHPRAVQAGIEQALTELARRAALSGAID